MLISAIRRTLQGKASVRISWTGRVSAFNKGFQSKFYLLTLTNDKCLPIQVLEMKKFKQQTGHVRESPGLTASTRRTAGERRPGLGSS